jgi:chaperonin GroEL
MIAEAMDKVGKEGVITVEESNTFGLELELTEGMRFDKGYISGYCDRPRAHGGGARGPVRPHRQLQDLRVKDLLPLLEKVMQSGKPWSSLPRTSTARHVHAGRQQDPRHVPLGGREGPGFGDRRKAMLQDIAILTGGQVISEEVGLKLDTAGVDLLGHARKVVITKDETTIVEVRATPTRSLVASTRSVRRSTSPTRTTTREAPGAAGRWPAAWRHQGRRGDRGRLKERKHRIEDAVRNAKAAVEEGIVAEAASPCCRRRSPRSTSSTSTRTSRRVPTS